MIYFDNDDKDNNLNNINDLKDNNKEEGKEEKIRVEEIIKKYKNLKKIIFKQQLTSINYNNFVNSYNTYIDFDPKSG